MVIVTTTAAAVGLRQERSCVTFTTRSSVLALLLLPRNYEVVVATFGYFGYAFDGGRGDGVAVHKDVRGARHGRGIKELGSSWKINEIKYRSGVTADMNQ